MNRKYVIVSYELLCTLTEEAWIIMKLRVREEVKIL